MRSRRLVRFVRWDGHARRRFRRHPQPFAGRDERDLGVLADYGEQLGSRLAGQIAATLPGAAIAYGKAALVGTDGDIEHAAALLHPKLGKPMRAAIGGGKAIIPSTAKMAHVGATIDVPLAHKDDVWSFDEIDTMKLMVADAPRPDEIVLIIAFAEGGRPRPRIGRSWAGLLAALSIAAGGRAVPIDRSAGRRGGTRVANVSSSAKICILWNGSKPLENQKNSRAPRDFLDGTRCAMRPAWFSCDAPGVLLVEC